MKKTVRIVAVVLILVLASVWYLRSGEGKAVLEKAGISRAGSSLQMITEKETDQAEELTGADETAENAETGSSGSRTESLSDAEAGESGVTGFTVQQKQELEVIIGACLEKNLNAMMEDGRLPTALAAYAETQSGLVNINTAGEEELTELNGIGPAKAAEIVKYREEHGNFQTVEELTGVPGISAGTLEKLRDQVTL